MQEGDLMTKEINYDVLEKLKSADKAKAFDMLVRAYRDNDDSLTVSDAQDVLSWCSTWFAND